MRSLLQRLMPCLLIVCLTCGNVQSQTIDINIKNQTDSLDKIKPLPLPQINNTDKVYVIRVWNQSQFDAIGTHLNDAIKAGKKNIVVKIGRGIYKFHENHIILEDFKKGEVSITIRGCNTVITSDGEYTKHNYCTSPWGGLIMADSLIEVVDDNCKLCMIPYHNSLTAAEMSSLNKVQITQWYKAPVYQVERIDQNGVYFVASELEYKNQFGRKAYNVNYDYLYAGKTPRFRLYDEQKERPCIASCFLRVNNAMLRSINLQGISFKGNKEGTPLIAMNSVVSSKVEIQKCEFFYIRSRVATFVGTGNVVFNNNKVSHTGGNELSFSGGCNNVRVTNNEFKDCGTELGNTICVCCNEADYYIANNTFVDFGYGAIGVGLWYGHTKKCPSQGIVENNEMFFTPVYFSNYRKHTLMDSGAIYTWTQNDRAIIRYNYIHDYIGISDNRGIFCDDGASNVMIYGNIILNTPNSYGIDSRKVKGNKADIMYNVNNFMSYNVVEGCFRFEGGTDNSKPCQKGVFIILSQNELGNKRSVHNGVEILGEDIYLQKNHNREGKLLLPKEYKWILKRCDI